MILKQAIIAAIAIAVCWVDARQTFASAPVADLSEQQISVLTRAYDQAKADGHENPLVVPGIIMQETRAGEAPNTLVAGPKGNRYYGLGQLKVSAARDVLTRWPTLWQEYGFTAKTDGAIAGRLMKSQAFNIEMTSKYLLLLRERYGFAGRRLVNAYNRGPGGVRRVDSNKFHYALSVEKQMASVRVALR